MQMDSISQITLGAAVSEAVMGRKVGNRALLWGAIAGTIPDLDVFIPFGDAVRDFTYHRGFSHSISFLVLLTPLLTWVVTRVHPTTTPYRTRWMWAIFFSLITHLLLDCFTVYGTQIFWPFTSHPVTWSTIFIIDPLYTLPLLIGTICALVMTRQGLTGHRLSMAGLILSTAYLAFTVGAKMHVDHVTTVSLRSQRIAHTQFLTTAAPFNTLLWRIVVMDDTGYYEGFYSLFDEEDTIRFRRYPSRPDLLEDIEDAWPIRRLRWFTKGFYRVTRLSDLVIMTDLRMGQEPFYIFSFIVGRTGEDRVAPAPVEQVVPAWNTDQLLWVWHRIWEAPAAKAGT